MSGTPFTAPRAANRRSWLYRIRPSVMHKPYREISRGLVRTAPFDEVATTPNQLRWDPIPIPHGEDRFRRRPASPSPATAMPPRTAACAFTSTSPTSPCAIAASTTPTANCLSSRRSAACSFTPNSATWQVAPGEICVIQRGIKFASNCWTPQARGYVCENYGALLRLPELGPIGANGLANARDFQTPVAAYEDRDGDYRVVAKFLGGLWEAEYDHSPLDVVAWHGNYAPYKYDLANFNCINTVSFDHPDPSIYTVLTSPSEIPGTANFDFAIFPPRWLVAEHTFRPPWFHRNFMNEFMGLIRGEYDAKAEGFLPGGASLHNCMAGHGPDAATYERASGRRAEAAISWPTRWPSCSSRASSAVPPAMPWKPRNCSMSTTAAGRS